MRGGYTLDPRVGQQERNDYKRKLVPRTLDDIAFELAQMRQIKAANGPESTPERQAIVDGYEARLVEILSAGVVPDNWR